LEFVGRTKAQRSNLGSKDDWYGDNAGDREQLGHAVITVKHSPHFCGE
jgi:hypothetical protein